MTVAEHRSFTLAADALGVSVSAASMQVRALEEYLGLPLFRRSGRMIEPTDEALQLLPRVREGLSALQWAIDEARVVRATGALGISSLPSFVAQWLSPRLSDFEARHPDIQLRLEASVVPVNFATSAMHAAVRYGQGPWKGLHCEKLLDEWLVVVCRPDLLKQRGEVNREADLERYRLLHSTTEPWSAWLTGVLDERAPEKGTVIDDSATVARLAAAGAGLALARWSLVADEVQRGQLALASPRTVSSSRRYYFVCPPKARGLAKVESFRSWLMEQAARFPAPPGAAAPPQVSRRRSA